MRPHPNTHFCIQNFGHRMTALMAASMSYCREQVCDSFLLPSAQSFHGKMLYAEVCMGVWSHVYAVLWILCNVTQQSAKKMACQAFRMAYALILASRHWRLHDQSN